jgi:hypothetical protein
MSYFSAAVIACPNVQGWLKDKWRIGRMPGADEMMPVAEFLSSAANRQGITTEITPGGGKVRTVQVKYRPRDVESNAKTNRPNPDCNPTGFNGELDETYTIDTTQNITFERSIPADAYDFSCTSNAEYFSMEVADMLDVMDRKVASQLTNEAVVLAGNWSASIPTGNGYGQVNAQDELVLRTMTAADVPYLMTWPRLQNALNDSGMGGSVLVSGGGAWREYFQASQAGCCSTQGIDLGQMFSNNGYAFVHDYRLERALGSFNKGMVFMPGAIQVVNWTRAGWRDGLPGTVQEGANYYHTAIASPRLGLAYDLTLTDDCGVLGIALQFTGKLIGMPVDAYATADMYYGTTGVTKIIAVN